jgi:acetoacetyl-CoA synthetase
MKGFATVGELEMTMTSRDGAPVSPAGRKVNIKLMKNEESPAVNAGMVRQGLQSRMSSLVPLKAGGGTPIFIAHGLGDTVMQLLQLATRMEVSHPIYGMQARGLDGIEEPLERIEDMAEFHLDAIRELQAHGPYFLIGYSLGGLVTLEMARRLKASGDEVALLVMLDSYPDRRHLTVGQRVRVEWRLATRRFSGLLRPDGKSEITTGALQRVKDAQYRALRKYRPAFYDGKVKFLRAAIPSYFPADPVPVWSGVVRELEVETVPGTHLEMLTTQVEAVASLVERYVKESLVG